jgi:hypothetical protein
MKGSMASEGGAKRFDQMSDKGTLASAVRAHDDDKKTCRLKPSPKAANGV